MSILDYREFLSDAKEKLNGILTVSAMEATLKALNEILFNYELQRIVVPLSGTDNLLESYMNAIQVEGKSAKTVKQYKYVLGKFFEAVGIPTCKVLADNIRKYFADEKARGISDTTLNNDRNVLNAYFGWLLREGLMHNNPMGNIKPIKCPKVVRHAYSDVDLEKLKMNCKSKRDKALVCFFYSSGCRVGEVVALNRENIDLINMECIVWGKGSKERHAYMDPITVMTIREYLDERTDNEPALFLNRYHKRISANGVRTILNKLAAVSGVDKVHPHKFRRTRATILIKHGMPIQEVAVILGHEKLDTTMRYVDLDQTDVKNDYRKYA